MIEQKVFKDLFNKIPNKANIIIFGACEVGKKILEDLYINKPNIKILGFIDNIQKGEFCNLPIWSLNEFINKNLKYDLVVMSTRRNYESILNIFDIYDIPVLPLTKIVNNYYRKDAKILNTENFNKVINIFEKKEDKNLFEIIFKSIADIINTDKIKKYFYNKKRNKLKTETLVKHQYLEKINKNSIKTILDVGFNNGLNVIAYKRFLPNFEKVYGFEVIYDIVKKDYIEDFILDDKVEIIPFLLGDINKKINFYINKDNLAASFASEISSKKRDLSSKHECRIVDIITIDEYCSKNNIKPDFIKMDIEGAELSALKGGIETIRKYRPQLAISIYHSHEDFINIPQYLSENLENYKFSLGHYSSKRIETVLYAIPSEFL